MMASYNVTAKWSEKTMEREESLRTVECLRGRLLAERAASKAANDESEQISNKLTELENQLKMEIKSRNKAEKRLRFLMKKLESLNIQYVSSADESPENSSLSEKSEISSVSSSTASSSSTPREAQDEKNLHKTQITDTSKCENGESQVKETAESQNCPSKEVNMGSSDEAISGNPIENEIQSSQKNGEEDELKRDDYHGPKSSVEEKEITNHGNDQDGDDHVDNSMALVMVEENVTNENGNNQDWDDSADNSMALVMVEENVTNENRNNHDWDDSADNSMALVMVDPPVKEEKQDPPIPSGSVKDVLDALRYARESLQSSMEMRRHNARSNIAQGRLNPISC